MRGVLAVAVAVGVILASVIVAPSARADTTMTCEGWLECAILKDVCKKVRMAR